MITPREHPDPVPEKWRWHYRRLQELRDRLLDSSGEHLAAGTASLEPNGRDRADDAVEEFDHGIALTLLSREQDSLREVEQAIRRIEDGSYGICEITGQPIPEERLRAIPWARCTAQVESLIP